MFLVNLKQWETLFSWAPKSLQMDCSHEIKRSLFLGRKAMTNLDSLLKSRDITESQRIDTFELWCWRRLLRVPWTARRSNQSILKESNPKYALEGLMLKLKLQYFGHLMWRTDSMEKTLMLGKIEGRRRRQQRMRWLDGLTDLMDVSLSQLWEMGKEREALRVQSMGLQKVRHSWVAEQLNNSK